MLPDIPTTIAFDTTSKGFAFAVLQGSETLLNWACSEVKTKTRAQAYRRIATLAGRYDPGLLVLADVDDRRRGEWARTLALAVESFAREHGIAVRRVSRDEVQEEFAASGTTKHEIAVAITRLFPELESRLPPKRKTWMSEDSRMSMFDAVSFALVALRRGEPVDAHAPQQT